MGQAAWIARFRVQGLGFRVTRRLDDGLAVCSQCSWTGRYDKRVDVHMAGAVKALALINSCQCSSIMSAHFAAQCRMHREQMTNDDGCVLVRVPGLRR